MGLEESLHKKMIKIVLGGVAPIEDDSAKKLACDEIKKSWKPSFKRIQSFFTAGITELKRDINKVAKKSQREQ